MEYSTFFEALSWAILQSTWQIAGIWLLYKLFVSCLKKNNTKFKYIAACSSLGVSFLLFLANILHFYFTPNLFLQSPILSIQGAPDLSIISPYIALVYLFFLFIGGYKFYQSYKYVRCLKTQQFNKPPYELKLFVEKYKHLLQLKQHVSIWVSEIIDSPITIGFFKPVILLPIAILNQVSVSQMETILLHELAHIKKNDYLVNFAFSCIETILFFHPFARLLAKDIRVQREYLADDFVLQFQYNPNDYALALLYAEKNRIQWHRNQLFQAATGINNQVLIQRINRFTQSSKSPKQLLKPFAQLVLSVGLLAFLLFHKPNELNVIEQKASNQTVLLAENNIEKTALLNATISNVDDSAHSSILVNTNEQYEILIDSSNKSYHTEHAPVLDDKNETKEHYESLNESDPATKHMAIGQTKVKGLFFFASFPNISIHEAEQSTNSTPSDPDSSVVAEFDQSFSNQPSAAGELNLQLTFDSTAFIVIDQNNGTTPELLEIGPIDSILGGLNWENIMHGYSIGKDMVKLVQVEIITKIVDKQLYKLKNGPHATINADTVLKTNQGMLRDSIYNTDTNKKTVLKKSSTDKNKIILKF